MKCRRCSLPIVFVQNTDTGKRIPVDAAPDEDGRVVARRVTGLVVADTRGVPLVGHVLQKGETPPAGWVRYMAHHATCRARPVRHQRRPVPQPGLFEYDTTQPERHTR